MAASIGHDLASICDVLCYLSGLREQTIKKQSNSNLKHFSKLFVTGERYRCSAWPKRG